MRKVIIPILLLGIIVAGCAQNQQQPTTPTEPTAADNTNRNNRDYDANTNND